MVKPLRSIVQSLLGARCGSATCAGFPPSVLQVTVHIKAQTTGLKQRISAPTNERKSIEPNHMNKNISQVWTFQSDSNPAVNYQTLQYVDGSTSCNCKGWTRRVAGDGTRSCKHTRYVDMGIADDQCTATHNYQTANNHQRKEMHYANYTNLSQNHIHQTPKLGQRKIAV